jgi:hypothetical protein
MSLHRTALLIIASLFTVGMTSVASAGCCNTVVYRCGGCGSYEQPVHHVRHFVHRHWVHHRHWHTPVTYTAWGCLCGPGRGLFNTYFQGRDTGSSGWSVWSSRHHHSHG